MNRVAFKLFGVDIMWYGILIGIGMAIAIYIALKETRRKGLDEDKILNAVMIAIPVGVICARVYYVVFSWDYYGSNPSEILDIRGGGLAIHGGLIGGIISAYIYSRAKKLNFLKLADTLLIGVPIAQAIGRWGNFINGEAHGGPTNLPWAITVDGTRVHPTFLYESLWNIIVFIILFLRRKKSEFDGEITFLYISLYSIGRFFIEGLRTDSLMLGPLRMAQVISLVFILVGVVGYFIMKKKNGGINGV